MNIELNETELLGDSYILREALARHMRHLQDQVSDLKKIGLQPSNLLQYELVRTRKLWKRIIELRGDTEFEIG